MSRLARMMGLGGAAALGAGLLLTTPAHAAQTPTATVTIPDLGGILCDDIAHEHQLSFSLDLDRDDSPQDDVDITDVVLEINGEAETGLSFTPNPIPEDGDHASGTVRVTGDQIDSVELTVTIESQGEGGEPIDIVLQDDVTDAECGGPASTSSTASTASTSSSTTATTAGSTTSTTAGGSTTTSSTSTTLGPNDTTGNLTVSPSTVAAGGSISVAGTGFAPGASVSLTLFSDPVSLGTLTANASGAISGSVAIPANTPAGAHKVEARGNNTAGNGINLLKADLTVRAASGSIPRTGGSSDFLLPVGIAVVSLGILAFAWRERRLSLR